MRCPVKQRQKLWFSRVTEKKTGIDTVREYSVPVMKKFTVSSTSGTPEEISAGIVPTYERYITSFDKSFNPMEGDVVYVDVVPQLNEDGSLAIGEDGQTPITPPDYRIVKIFDTKTGKVDRYGISRLSWAENE